MAPTHGKTPQNPPPLFEQKTGPHLPDLHSPDLSTSPGPRCRVRRAGVPSASLRWLAPVRWTSNLGEKGVRDGGGKRQVSPPTVDWWGRTMRPGSMIIYNQFGQRYGVVTIIHLSLARSGAQICTVSHDVCVCVSTPGQRVFHHHLSQAGGLSTPQKRQSNEEASVAVLISVPDAELTYLLSTQ